MNLYFLVEGQSTEPFLYRAWLRELAPSLTEVKGAYEAVKNNFFLFPSFGYPYILEYGLARAVEEVNEHRAYDYLVVCLDADEVSIDEREQEISQAMIDQHIVSSIPVLRVIQHKCIETWLLGNRRICQPPFNDDRLRQYVDHYNVRDLDPEEMPLIEDFDLNSTFHYDYLRKLISNQNPNRIGYSKRNPGHVAGSGYLDALLARTRDFPTHLRTFQNLVNILQDAEAASRP